MTGNVWEWCWDQYDEGWYSNGGAAQKDTHGPDNILTSRVMRGGSWISDASHLRCASRTYSLYSDPTTANTEVGFRCVIAVPASLPRAVLTDVARLLNGAFRFTITNLTPGRTNLVEISTNLTTWTPVSTNVPTGSTLEFTNSPAPGIAMQLFRSRQLP